MARDYQYKQSAKMTSAWPEARAPDRGSISGPSINQSMFREAKHSENTRARAAPCRNIRGSLAHQRKMEDSEETSASAVREQRILSTVVFIVCFAVRPV